MVHWFNVRPLIFAAMMTRHCFCLLFLLAPLRGMLAQEHAVFTPPQAYPTARYEADWRRNPFTLKTVVPLAAQDPFAKDMAIGAHYGTAENPTVVVVNTKTHERILLRKDKPAANGMRLKSVHVAITRSECEAEIVLGAQTAVVKYDVAYLGQLTATGAGRAAAPKGLPPPGTNGVRLPPLSLPAPTGQPPPGSVVKVTQLTPMVPIAPRAAAPQPSSWLMPPPQPDLPKPRSGP